MDYRWTAESGQRLREARHRRLLTQRDIAHRVGVTVTMATRWEKAIHRPSPEHLRQLADVLQVSPYWLIGVEPDLELPEFPAVIDRVRRLAGSTEGKGDRWSAFLQHLDFLLSKPTAKPISGRK